jgi:uncharacterized alkaline shock family protein YloU
MAIKINNEPQTELELPPGIQDPQAAQQSPTGGSLTIKDSVVAKIAGVAAREVEGVSLGTGSFIEAVTGNDGDARRGIKVKVGEKQAAFDIAMVVDYGYNIPAVVSEVRQRITQRIYEMTGLETTVVNIEIADVALKDQKEEQESAEVK